ncbi:S1 domain-containing RNA-binding protein [Ligilactobacillus ceti]|uniref:S1 motif domain-containing protein n=1 Tax=Ligilactobacillus ceti DSM 22408 TaxID=1122146 RepID=A0A0R2KIN8_9LACO|nr:S1 domain-containing RNA-binding protein [Ligilactobacillus ceti]KRN89257.1 hypothetical protein IV53_GL000170 [Ligilactobacillus ceti DSM 22408]
MSVEVGAKVDGKVTGITNFGAFVDLGDKKTGLVHISEVSDGFIKDINDVLTVGDEVKVKVLTISDDGKIGLSIRKAVDKPQRKEQPSERKPQQNRERSGNQPQNRNRNYQGTPNKGNASHGNRNAAKSKSFVSRKNDPKSNDFDSLLAGFLKDSEDRLTSLKRNTEGKRGGRGGRRS